jgi:hypothetical protein
MADKGHPARMVKYQVDGNTQAYALVLEQHGDKYDLAWLDPDNYQWHAANDVPDDRVK